ncbi:MAG: hypothetical protein CM15mV121_350 [uncultured marine virus]|nr:MAG: hypothetical protein CM15mV121_350 [uncultured marine virus]
MAKKRDPKVGTGKKPKGSGRRLYTDENPKDTVGIKFATPTDARKTVAKVKRINKPFARKIQILTVGEQRAKVMGKTQVASIFKKGKESIRKGRKIMALAKSQRSLKAWGNRNGERSLARSLQLRENGICQRKLSRVCHLQSMRQRQEQNEEEQKRANNL